ncbi:GIY-YIG nuclease family protein [Rhodobacter ferrooxidans]|uniref:GIY-YIG domain-containing protein n=1 Tax=Rhodobacter ferrooxidans TaxID=371731 RepID=C8S3K1_9RHOB|nr:GIY-YIG nuclease family protein [Rhodobacter sp. SW2]EEW24449.1 conserved hypothetical protein [Rhodobacter sp. SW2]
MKFNLLLRDGGFDPAQVSVILHTTNLHPFRALLPVVVADHPDLFDAYQSVHSRSATAILLARPFAASFVPLTGRRMVFAGLFAVRPEGEFPVEDIYADPRFARLEKEFGATDTGPAANLARGGRQVRFAMSRLEALSDLVGRLTIAAPGGRTYVRIAANLGADIAAISEESLLRRHPPEWREMILSAIELRALPRDWAARLAEWRGVYLIVDQTDGARYVGSAYGAENLLGRWRAHVAGDRGVTVELARRDPAAFRFSILQRLDPDLAPDQVIGVEQNWKRRLDTVSHGLNRA